jgi:hypothetical protein
MLSTNIAEYLQHGHSGGQFDTSPARYLLFFAQLQKENSRRAVCLIPKLNGRPVVFTISGFGVLVC